MKNILITAVTLFSATFSFAQVERNVGEFNKLKVYDKIPVELISSLKNLVVIDGVNAEDVQVENNNGELKLKMTGVKLMQGGEATVKVYYKSLYDIQASQGSTIYSDDEVKVQSLNLTSNEGSSIKLPVDVNRLEVKINSGAEVILRGKAETQTVISNSGGKYFSKTLEAQSSSLTTNAGGVIEATSTDSVDAKTRAGGVIDIYGNPERRNQKKIAGGKINFK
ncbi:head GIN domain-containing protein [Empedobacter sedimenti]|uniref:head GIN domain-containing protein n=1 Tax=Empedobacter sedimenti TaxID=3042610 RepID=UPI0024A74A70|nr:head GIN domain-containing protein [Empedobacter sedimenti]